MSRVTTEISDHIATVTLSRPDKMNAVDPEMAEAIVAAGQALWDSDVRAIVLTGAGRAFCAGLDVMSFAQIAAADPEALIMPRSHGNTNLFQEVALIWRRLPVPVIAALHGVCYGAGLQLASGADIRIAAPDTSLAIMEMKWGLVPDMGGMAIWPQMVRSDVLRQLIYTAGKIDGTTAERVGLVTELAEDPLLRAQELARQIAAQSPSAIQAAKRLTNLAESGIDQDAILLAESREQSDLVGKPHQMEVIAANMQKRPPVFD